MPATVRKKVCLIVYNGCGISKATPEGNAIAAETPMMDRPGKKHAFEPLSVSGTAVGLSNGLMWDSEVGHLNLGAGRIVWQDIVRIDMSIKKKSTRTPLFLGRANAREKPMDVCMLFIWCIFPLLSSPFSFTTANANLSPQVSEGVHSHTCHFFSLFEIAKEQGIPETYIRFLGHGRDTHRAPRPSMLRNCSISLRNPGTERSQWW